MVLNPGNLATVLSLHANGTDVQVVPTLEKLNFKEMLVIICYIKWNPGPSGSMTSLRMTGSCERVQNISMVIATTGKLQLRTRPSYCAHGAAAQLVSHQFKMDLKKLINMYKLTASTSA